MSRGSALAVIGSRDLAQLIAHHAVESGEWGRVAGFFDDFREPGEATPRGPILGALDQVGAAYAAGEFEAVIVGIGYRHLSFREHCFQLLSGSVPVGRVISRGCHIDSTASVGEGTFLLPGCVLDAGTVVGPNCVLNTGVVIAHDSRVAGTSFLGPGTRLAGFVNIGQRCFLGVGTVISDSVTVADDIQTGAGAVVVGSLTEPGLYLGVPARYHRPHRS